MKRRKCGKIIWDTQFAVHGQCYLGQYAVFDASRENPHGPSLVYIYVKDVRLLSQSWR
jgi:hypothetical protein